MVSSCVGNCVYSCFARESQGVPHLVECIHYGYPLWVPFPVNLHAVWKRLRQDKSMDRTLLDYHGHFTANFGHFHHSLYAQK